MNTCLESIKCLFLDIAEYLSAIKILANKISTYIYEILKSLQIYLKNQKLRLF